MPTCPGCQEQLPHRRLPVHARFCEGVLGEEPSELSVFEYLDTRISSMEHRFGVRLTMLEREFESSITGNSRLSSADSR